MNHRFHKVFFPAVLLCLYVLSALPALAFDSSDIQPVYRNLDTTACDSLLWRGTVYRTSGEYYFRIPGSPGAPDTLETLRLALFFNVRVNTTMKVCDSLSWRGSFYTASGDYGDTVPQVVLGVCDSIFHLHLTVVHDVVVDFEAQTCEYYVWRGTSYTESGVYSVHIPNVVDEVCDSVFRLTLTLYQNDTLIQTDEVCDSCQWHGSSYTQSGRYSYVVPSVAEPFCDSIYILDLTVNHSTVADIHDTVVEDDLPYSFNHRTYNDYVDFDTLHLVNTNGCDSLINYSLYIVWHYLSCDTVLQFPTLVTPNGDGINDRFIIKNLVEENCYPNNELIIYDRWGSVVFHAYNIAKEDDFWDPSKVACGSYFYHFVARGMIGSLEHNGIIEVLR